MADKVLAEQPHLAEAPIALAGISFGALLAFEIGCRLHERGVPPVALFLASQRALKAPSIDRSWHKLPDAQLIAQMVEIGGLDEELAGHAELIEIFLGVIRADLQASETYVSPARPRLDCPLFIYRGVGDPAVSDEDMEAWRGETSGPVAIRRLPAGHFLTAGADDLWLAALRADLASLPAVSKWNGGRP
jgi:surfactin synthase thioesterase subunit